jgi:TonB family protein
LRVTQSCMKKDAHAGLERAEVNTGPFAGVLLSSRPGHDLRGAAQSTAWSVIAHGCVVVVLMLTTMPNHEVIEFFELPEAPSPPRRPLVDTDAFGPTSIDFVYPTFPMCVLPISMPDSIPVYIPPTQWGVRSNEEAVGPEEGRADGTAGGRPQHALAKEPVFTEYTIAPELKNTAEVVRVLTRVYPPLLHDAGLGGTVLLWFLIDETGKVVKTLVKESSGHSQLDQAAACVAEVMVFSPAINGDRKVAVWVEIPIFFNSR